MLAICLYIILIDCVTCAVCGFRFAVPPSRPGPGAACRCAAGRGVVAAGAWRCSPQWLCFHGAKLIIIFQLRPRGVAFSGGCGPSAPLAGRPCGSRRPRCLCAPGPPAVGRGPFWLAIRAVLPCRKGRFGSSYGPFCNSLPVRPLHSLSPALARRGPGAVPPAAFLACCLNECPQVAGQLYAARKRTQDGGKDMEYTCKVCRLG